MADIRLAWLATHPTQYQAPLLRTIAKSPGIDLTAIFFSDFSTRNYVDREFGRAVEWDVPLLEGYRHEFLRRGDQKNGISFFRPRLSGLKERLTREYFDAVLVQGWNHYGYVEAAWRSQRAGLKVLLRCEATDHVASSTGIKGKLREVLVRFMLSQADQFLAIGTRNREFYLARGVAPERIGAMPYCVDNAYFRARAEAADTEALRNELGLEADRPVILYASKLIARKYGDNLLEAYARLPAPRPYLLFIGDGELREPLVRRVEEGKLADVRFLGFRNQSELPTFYALADIFVLPSVNETWGLVVNEAMNAGCAIVVSDQVGSGADLVRNGDNGFVVPACNVNALTQALADTLTGGRYRSMGQRSLESIAQWGVEANVAGLRSALGLSEVQI